jgi:L-ribulose-5-phosphate 3-epimerase
MSSEDGGLTSDARFCGTTVCYPTVQGDEFTLDRALAGIAGCGFKHVEIASVPGYCEHFKPEDLDLDAAARLRRRIEDAGLAPAVANIAADLTTDAGVERLLRCMELSSALGVGCLVTHIEQTATADGARAFHARVERLAECADRHAVRVGLETHGGLCTTGVEAVGLVKQLGSPYLGVTYDTANVIYWGGVRPEEDLSAIEEDIGRHVFHFHLKDKATTTLHEYLFPAFGEGVVDFRRIGSLISSSGYSGYLSLEVELDGHPKTAETVDAALARSLAHMEAISK